MEFLKIYDCTNQMNDMAKNNQLLCEVDHILRYFIQEDVHDFHVFRIISGTYDEEFEGCKDEVMTVEHQKICKYDVTESLVGSPAKSRNLRDAVITGTYDEDLIKHALLIDTEKGLENWDYTVSDSTDIEAAIEIVKGDFCQIQQ